MAETAHARVIDAQTGQDVDLAMQQLHLSGRAYPTGSFIRATHRFKCAGDKPREILYVFMLPRQGTLRRFTVKGEDFEVTSRLEERKDARKEYEAGVEDGHLSVLAETSMDGMVTLTVGQVRPDEEVAVILDVVVGVANRDDGYNLRFPFTIAPSYHPQAIMSQTAAGGKIELPEDIFGDIVLPEWRTNKEGMHGVSFKILVDPGAPLDSVASPSHRILVRPQDDGTVEVELAGSADVPDRDMVLEVKTRKPQVGLFVDESLAKGSKPTGADVIPFPQDAPMWSLVVPSSVIPKAQGTPRKICLVVDHSGSMGDTPMTRAKQATDACLAGLGPNDEFGLVVFDDQVDAFDDKMCKATKTNRKRAQEWMAQVCSRGGTDLSNGLAKGIEVLGGPGGDILLITDGQVSQTGPIVEQVGASGTRVHILGIGAASQDRFLSMLARRSKGVQKMVNPNEDVAGAGLELFNAVKHPVQVDVTADMDGKIVNVGTVWEGVPIIVTDPGTNGIPKSFLIKWNGGEFDAIGTMTEVPDGLVGLLWAGRKIEDLEAALDLTVKGPAASSIKLELKALSKAYHLASREMSLISVVKRAGDQPEAMEQHVVPVGQPEGMSMFDLMSVTRGIRLGSAGPQVRRFLGGGSGVRSRKSKPRSAEPAASWTSNRVDISESYFSGSDITLRGGGSTMCSTGLVMQDSPDGVDYEPLRLEYGLCSTDAPGDFQPAGFPNNPLDIMQLLTNLEDDGGMPDEGLGRILATILAGLKAYNIQVENNTSMFSMHLQRMATYLLNNRKGPQAALIEQIAKLFTHGSQKVPVKWDAFLSAPVDQRVTVTWQVLETSVTNMG